MLQLNAGTATAKIAHTVVAGVLGLAVRHVLQSRFLAA
jgi:hypothetical protein